MLLEPLHCKEAKIDIDEEDLHPTAMAENAALKENDTSMQDEEVDPDFKVEAPTATSFDLNGPDSDDPNLPHIIEDEEDHQADNVSADFLKCHQKFNHCSPKRVQNAGSHWRHTQEAMGFVFLCEKQQQECTDMTGQQSCERNPSRS